MSEEKIILTEEGYKRMKDKLAALEKELAEIKGKKAEAYENAGDGWAHNPSLELLIMDQERVMKQIDEYRDRLKKATVILE